MNTVKTLLQLLTPRERRQGLLLLGMVLMMALFDVVGVASIFPVISALANPQLVETNAYLSAAYSFLGIQSVERFLVILASIAFLALMFSIAFKALTTYALLRFTHMRNYSISQRLVNGYLRQPYEWFLHRHSADLGKTILAEVQQVVTGTLIPFGQVVAHGAVVIALLVLLMALAPVIALVSAIVLGGSYALIYTFLRRYLGGIGKDRIQANRERFSVVQETFGGIKDVKVSGLEAVMLRRFDGPAKSFAKYQAGSQIAAQLPRFALEGVVFGGMLGIVFYFMRSSGGIEQALPLLSVFAFASYRLMPALQQVYSQLSNMRFSGPALESLHKDLAELGAHSPLVRNQPQPMAITQSIKLDCVFYTYPKSLQPALRNLTLEIPARKTVGLVGATGSGKTTSVDIILGLLRPQSGRLIVDGAPITDENLRGWQRSIGYVPQSIYLADDTITANIAFGLPADKIDMDAVERAARVANLHDFVAGELSAGYGTMVGERGVRLSGGQRQRIGIARALYHDPQVLILDEATSALDNLTEKAVMEAVSNLGGQKTIILIAHRLSTVQECDNIFIVESGSLVDRGTYQELIARNERFRAMAGKQH